MWIAHDNGTTLCMSNKYLYITYVVAEFFVCATAFLAGQVVQRVCSVVDLYTTAGVGYQMELVSPPLAFTHWSRRSEFRRFVD